jgi:L-lactate dehydrogenase (cytochrome)
MLTGNKARDTSVDVLGTPSPVPFFLAPIGVLSIAHPEGELAAARAAAALRIPFTLSSAASHSIEEIAEAMGDAPRWFQLYWVNDREICASFVGRAEAVGYAAIVVTLDTLVLGWRPRDLRNAPTVPDRPRCAQFFSDPVFCSRLDKSPRREDARRRDVIATFPNRLTWSDLAWLRNRLAPLLVKACDVRGRSVP